MPPIRAACARFIPSSTPANDKSRRLWFALLVAPASRRSSPAEKSLRTLTAAGMARILPAPWNQLSPKYGIPVSHKRWPLVSPVIPDHEVGILGAGWDHQNLVCLALSLLSFLVEQDYG
jgi:hypothetical protein